MTRSNIFIETPLRSFSPPQTWLILIFPEHLTCNCSILRFLWSSHYITREIQKISGCKHYKSKSKGEILSHALQHMVEIFRSKVYLGSGLENSPIKILSLNVSKACDNAVQWMVWSSQKWLSSSTALSTDGQHWRDRYQYQCMTYA